MASMCEHCLNYEYDEDYDCYTCVVDLDEDEMARFMMNTYRDCPHFMVDDEYAIVRKQN